jgi:hypothetical protein
MTREDKLGNALATLITFLEAIINGQWENAKKYVMKSWANTIQSIFASIDVKSYQIQSYQELSDVCVEVQIILTYNDLHTLPHGRTQERVVKIIKESTSVTPSIYGEWGVSPLTVRYGKDDQKKKRTIVQGLLKEGTLHG